jgi:hypothetical protein
MGTNLMVCVSPSILYMERDNGDVRDGLIQAIGGFV